MSRSPDENASSDQVRAYDVGWAATNQLIRSGKSFSGREKNCTFLNLGSEKRFADISSTSGLDYPDDGRGLALTDWDRDGRVDMWVMNRTGPRVRFVRNKLNNDNAFLALRLKGNNGNTDGIGARVQVVLKKKSPVIVKTLHAGSGYLSQSSKWLHFGLGSEEAAKIKSLKVRWPGGKSESFSGATANGHFLLEQGKGVATLWKTPSVSLDSLEPSAEQPPAPPELPSRVILLNPAPVPNHLTFTNSTGEQKSLVDQFGKQPVALHLFATWCPNCNEEMKIWTAAAKKLSNAGIKVLAICVDEPADDRLAKVNAFAKEMKLPFEIGLANASLVENLNVLQRSFIGRQSDFPIPSTILVDISGLASSIYKGPVSPDQLINDAQIFGANPSTILAHAIPYPGQWKTEPKGLVPRTVAVKLIANGMLDDARSYIHQLLPLYQGKEDEESVSEASECHRILGAIAHDKKEYDTAISHYLKSLEIIPEQKMVLTELMRVYVHTGETAKAAEQVEAILKLNRKDHENLAQLADLRQKLGQIDEAISLFRESLDVRFHPATSTALANLLRSQGKCAEALKHYAASLEAHPQDPLTANNYAWILATHPDSKLRDGAKAKHWAQVACDLTNNRIPPLLGTLAAAHAELGEFERAIEISQKAIISAREFKKEELAKRLADRMIFSYQSKKPFRDPSLIAKPGE